MDPEKRRRLPRWIDDADQPGHEVEECRKLTLDQRGERLAQVCRLAMAILNARADADVAFAFKSPLPEESVALLERLRERYRRQ